MRTDKEPDKIRRISDWPRRWLEHRYVPWHLAALAILLCAPSLWLGWQFDDDFHRLALTQPEGSLLHRSPAELFAFIRGNEAENRQSVIVGMLPWWSHEKLRIAFFRPLTGLTHWLDYQLWPNAPSLMHMQSLVWFGGVVAAAAFLYRRMLSPARVAGLAALLFAVDDAHGLPAVWLANRNALLGAFFGLLTLISHDRWRRDGSRLAAVLAPVMLLLGLLSKESTVATGGNFPLRILPRSKLLEESPHFPPALCPNRYRLVDLLQNARIRRGGVGVVSRSCDGLVAVPSGVCRSSGGSACLAVADPR